MKAKALALVDVPLYMTESEKIILYLKSYVVEKMWNVLFYQKDNHICNSLSAHMFCNPRVVVISRKIGYLEFSQSS